MNDRFKFRAWDRINDKWLSNKNRIEIGTGYLTDFFDVEQAFNRRYVLMQCTGLKDKNGKLIYEGDVVKQGDAKYVVNWLEGTFCFKGLKTLHNFTIEYVMPSKQEVIGNIYENKELLESEG